MSELQACDFKDPETLKDILEIFEKLNGSSTAKKNVGQKLLKDVEKYCDNAEKFYKDSGSGSGFLWSVFQYAGTVRENILETGRTIGTYKNLDSEHGKHEDCVAEALKKCLPKAYAALYFLLFMGSEDMNTLQGGDWHDYACNGNDYGHRSGSKVDLQLWLIDQKGQNTGLVKRGFSGLTLTNKKGSEVAPVIKQIISHDSAKALQKVLLYLLLVCPWDNALLGHACLFLSTFCDQVKDHGENFQNYFSSSALEELKRVCSTVKENLKTFTHASDSSLPLSAVCQSNSELYSKLWNPEAIPLYVKWLQGNLNGIIQSLNLMSSEASSKWDSGNLQTADTAGPFRFGFVFKGSWSDGTFKSQLPSKISPLINSGSGSLQSLQKSLENFSTGNPGATAGGVFAGILGTGGLGAGAAYATNAFGFQNFITSFISGFLK